MSTRREVYAAIESERAYQDLRWPDHDHKVGAFLTYMSDYLLEACHLDSRYDASEGRPLPVIRKFAALCVVAMEQNGINWRDFNITHAPCKREEIYRAIDQERNEQQLLRPNSNLEVSAELTLLRRYMRKAEEAWSDYKGDFAALAEVRILAAIAVRCMEHHGAPMREMPLPQVQDAAPVGTCILTEGNMATEDDCTTHDHEAPVTAPEA